MNFYIGLQEISYFTYWPLDVNLLLRPRMLGVVLSNTCAWGSLWPSPLALEKQKGQFTWILTVPNQHGLRICVCTCLSTSSSKQI